MLINDTGAGELAAGDFAGLKLKPAAIEQVKKYDYSQELKRENTCVPPSVVFYMQAPFPMEIYQGRDLIVFKMEYFDMVPRRVPRRPPASARERAALEVGVLDGPMGRATRSSSRRRTSSRARS